jgi:hypothetical protein
MKGSFKENPGTEESRPAPGRPRTERLDQAILKAAVDLVLASGFRTLSMDAIAAKAEVGRLTDQTIDAMGCYSATAKEIEKKTGSKSSQTAMRFHVPGTLHL